MLLMLCSCMQVQAKEDTLKKVIWAFPITSYIKPLKQGIQVVHVKLPSNISFTKDKQVALLRGVARGAKIDAGKKGYGKCNLIKGQYNYFSVFMDSMASEPREGDLLYTIVPRSTFGYMSPVFDCASHGISFKTVTDTEYYKPSDFLKKRTKEQDDALLHKMLGDIHYTGSYFLHEDSTKNIPISEGNYKGRKVLDVMMNARDEDLTEFLRFVAARPRRYAGNSWKISETFATWVIHGAPMVVPD